MVASIIQSRSATLIEDLSNLRFELINALHYLIEIMMKRTQVDSKSLGQIRLGTTGGSGALQRLNPILQGSALIIKAVGSHINSLHYAICFLVTNSSSPLILSWRFGIDFFILSLAYWIRDVAVKLSGA